jgi:HrpA-like RNA helicase
MKSKKSKTTSIPINKKNTKLKSKSKSKTLFSKKSNSSSTHSSNTKPEFIIEPDGIMDPEGNYPNPFTGKPATPYYKSMALTTIATKPWTEYQPWKDRVMILNMIHNHQIILVIASTGVGKTVIFPKLLAHYFHYKKPIITTMPRQKMLSEGAEFAAKLMDVPLFQLDEDGKDVLDENGNKIKTNMFYVGYRHGDEKTMSDKNTKLLFATDSLVKQLIQRDHLLNQYGGIIIDEAHERSIHIDILIKLVLDIARERPDFKIIIMSATINKDTFISYFDRQGMKSKFAMYESIAPTQYKINIVNKQQPVQIKTVIPEMYNTIKKILLDKNSRRGDILAFVSSESETNKLARLINESYKEFRSDWKPYGCAISRNTLEMDKTIAIEKNGLELATAETGRPYNVKVIVATNIAESGMTFKTPVVYVIESGMAYDVKWDASNYVYSAGKTYITEANIKQRCGRTGRTIEGDCIQMYTRLQYEKFAKFPAPSITKEDLTGELLSILCLPQIDGSLKKAIVFLQNMIEPIINYRDKIIVAIRNLFDMDLLLPASDEDPKALAVLSPVGKILNRFGKIEVRSARMVLAAALMGIGEPAMMLAAILLTITRPDDFFFKRKDADRRMEMIMQKVKQRCQHPSGDHMTLLNIFINWFNSENQGKFVYDNMLNRKMLERIRRAFLDLVKLVNGLNLENVNLVGIEKVSKTRLSLRPSKMVTEAMKLEEKLEHKPEEPTLEETEVGEDAVIAENVKESSKLSKSKSKIKKQKGGLSKNNNSKKKEYNREEINFQKYVPDKVLEKLLLAIGYGFNTNLGYYNDKFKSYQIMHSKYMVDMSESVLVHNKKPPKYVIYYMVVHQEEKGNTDFQIVSEISEEVLMQLVKLKKLRDGKLSKLDWEKIKMEIDNIKKEE